MLAADRGLLWASFDCNFSSGCSLFGYRPVSHLPTILDMTVGAIHTLGCDWHVRRDRRAALLGTRSWVHTARAGTIQAKATQQETKEGPTYGSKKLPQKKAKKKRLHQHYKPLRLMGSPLGNCTMTSAPSSTFKKRSLPVSHKVWCVGAKQTTRAK